MYYFDLYFRHLWQPVLWRNRVQLVTPGETLEIANSSEGRCDLALLLNFRDSNELECNTWQSIRPQAVSVFPPKRYAHSEVLSIATRQCIWS